MISFSLWTVIPFDGERRRATPPHRLTRFSLLHDGPRAFRPRCLAGMDAAQRLNCSHTKWSAAKTRLAFTGWASLFAAVVGPAGIASAKQEKTPTIRIDLKLCTGGEISGLVVDSTPEAVVVVRDHRPYAFSWDEVEAGSAYAAHRDLLALRRKGIENLTAEDYYHLGLFALSRGRNDMAAGAFRHVKKQTNEYDDAIRKAFHSFRKRSEIDRRRAASTHEKITSFSSKTGLATDSGLFDQVDQVFRREESDENTSLVTRNLRGRILAVYRQFGQTVQRVMGREVVLLETDHFLIWTDWESSQRTQLGRWCEQMYAALCEQFQCDPRKGVFPAKCPVFCWRSKARFRKFARQFDGYDGKNAIGYTRSLSMYGHSHIVLVRLGSDPRDFDRFASTLVHEGTHAFVHCFHSNRLIPHWINEGLADLIAQRVLGDRCHNDSKAALLARQFVRYDWPIGELLDHVGPIEVQQYPLAHSVVSYLVSRDKEKFTAFFKSLKDGRTIPEALAGHYDGLTLDALEAGWRSSVRRLKSSTRP